MIEQPNLEYINQIANGNTQVFDKLILIIKEEFPQEKADYFQSVSQSKTKTTAENVHRLKHKISILGLEKAYELANSYEHNLIENSFELKNEFEQILENITIYIDNL